MSLRIRATNRTLVASVAALAAVAATLGSGLTATSYAAGPTVPKAHAATVKDSGFYDARQGTGQRAKAAVLRRAAVASRRPATLALRRSLGPQTLLDIDGTTGTPRLVGNLDGFLTGRSNRSPASVALGFVAAHHAALGLTTADLSTFTLRRDYRDIEGTHHLSWVQEVGGHEVFGNGLNASVTKHGELISISGSPVSGADPVSARSGLRLPTRASAIRAAKRGTGEKSTTPGARDRARQVLFVTPQGSFLGWQTVTMSAQHPALSVLDAKTGRLLYRRSLTDDAVASEAPAQRRTTPSKGHSKGLAFAYFPKAPEGGTQHQLDFTEKGWLPATAKSLTGNNAHAFSDVNDDNTAERTEEVGPSSPHRWDYRLKPFTLPGVSFCGNPYPCSWDPNTPYSWRTNRAQNTTQVFSYVNNWHDHLLRSPIGFTEAAGNFQEVNKTGAGSGSDPVDTQTEDGANTADGLPDGAHVDNANMDTPPDGQAPTMQMYLQHQPGTTYPDGDPYSPTNVGDEADTVYHEYTHGLSNRLVVDPTGNSTLGLVEAGSMGEAWSDWYAMDYLVDQGLQKDRKGVADVMLFQYDGAGAALDRTEPMDCKVGESSARCTGGESGHTGGYTYADYGQVIGYPEVHADGEIWSQTLWDLRDALGSERAESLVTRAMELSPSDPSFLDERNAILMADEAVRHGRDQSTIWRVFAHRGMGYYAGSFGGEDSVPAADFHTPPTSQRTGTITGRVLDATTHRPAVGVPVTLAFQGGGPVNPSVVTDADGRYRLGPVPVGSYGKLVVSGAGFLSVTKSVTVTTAGATVDFTTRRDWAAAGGGATVASFTGPDFTSSGCGPGQAIDLSQSTGWGSTTGDDVGTPTNVFKPKDIVIALPTAVDVTTMAVDPTATCGDGPSSSLARYRIETSPNGTTWTTASSGTFTSADNGRLNPLTPTTGTTGVRFVRLTMLSNQTPSFATNCPAGAFTGCSYTDMTEIEVFGTTP